MFDQARAQVAAYREAELRPVLEPDEVILAEGLVQSALIGRDAIETAPGRLEEVVSRAVARVDALPPLPKGFLAVVGAAAAIADPGALIPAPDLDRLLGGEIGRGSVGSVAAAFKASLDTTAATTLVVTDRRVAVTLDSNRKVRVEGLSLEVTLRDLRLSLPRSAVAGVRRRRRLLEWGRLELLFADGSSITVTAGMISGRRADRLAAALATYT